MQRIGRVLVCGHRGSAGTHPENTLASFEAALAAGVDMIECDVHLSADGVPVILHDPTLDRTTTGTGPVESYTVEQLKQFDAGVTKGERFAGQRIPTLAELLDLAAGRADLNIELKADRGDLVEAVLRLIRHYRLERRCVLGSFHVGLLEQAKRLCPEVWTQGIAADFEKLRAWPDEALTCLNSVALQFASIGPEQVDFLIGMGLGLWAWTVNEPQDALRLARLGVGMITSDYPARIACALAEADLR